MQVASIELYDLLKGKLGEKEAKSLLTFIESEVESKYEQKKNSIASKQDIADLRVEIREMKAEIIKWLFLFIIGQTGVIITVLKLLFS